ncbi:putative secreted protein [Streptomyces davaonensis JCM 4913]|uniref:Putative secreted protein n=1 Tax=Streptomyces davaonensis (strain DSM 101723 / JCM 4913 / KCC S-0913 / 768) TaxID=1214101 RepID=K4R168_STRDJ|nr:putative secreted protein [Streptomyces davaonensis]CCK26404.1 putative secreted protein [Streptomyces davaonensis JCM 4913]
MNTVFSVLVLGTASALAYAAAAVAQRVAALRSAGSHGLGLRRSGAWWISLLLNALGAVLHTAALRYGSLVAVQMLGVLTLVAAPLLSSAVLRQRLSAAQWSGTGLTVAGVVGLLALVPSAGESRTLDSGELIGVVLLTAVAMGVPVVVAAVGRGAMVASLSYAAAAGVAFAAASALAQTAVLQVTGLGSGTFASTVLVAGGVLFLAPAGLLLCQLAYRGGLEAPLATVTLVNPVFAVVVGVAVLGDRYATGLMTVAVGLVAAVAAGRGVFILARAETSGAPEGSRPQVAAPGGHFWGIRLRRSAAVVVGSRR